MKHKLRKGLAVGVICLLMLVTVPMVSGERIHYPREEGPYTVLIMGNCSGMGGGISTIWRINPFWFLFYPRYIQYDFDNDSIFFVNGEEQDILYPACIDLAGFKGYGQTTYMMILKWRVATFMYFLTGFLVYPRARVGGLCAEIYVWDAR
ncbi:MAG: hypothetical protein JSW06_01165 [Thermoplasmatales archaeon]|nr:MAG: hypothetical protein JSW06_01165 [Thermoplasmatales archaeon]